MRQIQVTTSVRREIRRRYVGDDRHSSRWHLLLIERTMAAAAKTIAGAELNQKTTIATYYFP
jgi:hypothetical protein